MQTEAFRTFLKARGLADKTVEQRIYALQRIEKAEASDLETAFEEDGMSNLISLYSYSTQNERESRSNPSAMDIDPDKLLSHLRWYKSHLNAYRLWKIGADPDEDTPDGSEVETASEQAVTETAVGLTFGLERDLQIALRANLHQLEPGLIVADGGSETRVAAGLIDILGQSADGDWVVIELKAGKSRPEAIAQILSYMGCIAESKGGGVRGILIAADHDARVEFAARAVSNLTLKRYAYRFDFL